MISESVRKVLNENKWTDGNDEPSQNNLPPIGKYHPDYWYYRQEEEPYDPTYDEGYLDDYSVNNDDEFKDDLDDWSIEENKQYNKNRNMKRTIRLRESELRQMIAESVKRVLKEGFEDEYNATKQNYLDRKSPNGMWGFEMKNQEGDWEYGDIQYDPNTQTMSCMGVSIDVDPDLTVDQNLEALHEELMNNGYGYDDE